MGIQGWYTASAMTAMRRQPLEVATESLDVVLRWTYGSPDTIDPVRLALLSIRVLGRTALNPDANDRYAGYVHISAWSDVSGRAGSYIDVAPDPVVDPQLTFARLAVQALSRLALADWNYQPPLLAMAQDRPDDAQRQMFESVGFQVIERAIGSDGPVVILRFAEPEP
jgi:hypothetical protein